MSIKERKNGFSDEVKLARIIEASRRLTHLSQLRISRGRAFQQPCLGTLFIPGRASIRGFKSILFDATESKDDPDSGKSRKRQEKDIIHSLKVLLTTHTRDQRDQAKGKTDLIGNLRTQKEIPYFDQRRFKDSNALGGNVVQDIFTDEPGLQRLYRSPRLKAVLDRVQQRISIAFDPLGAGSALPRRGKARFRRLTKMKSFVQVISTPTADCRGTALLLHFDKQKYLVGNLGEGTTRACTQFGARLLKVSDILITGRSEWRNVGGLVGVMLSLADSRKGSMAQQTEKATQKVGSNTRAEKEPTMHRLRFWGPPNLNHTIATCRRFVFRTGVPLEAHEFREIDAKRASTDPDWRDDYVQMWAMAVKPKLRGNNDGLSPRKRSWDESNGDEAQMELQETHDQADREQQIRKAVVDSMFNSNWRLDALYETPLKDVILPAAIFVRDPDTKMTIKYEGPLPGGKEPVPDPELPVLVRRPWPAALIRDLPPTKPAADSVSYIIKNHRQRGKFIKSKALELKVPMGPLWSELTSGRSVRNLEGEIITPNMVLEPGKDGGGVAVLDIPTLDYVQPLLSREEWHNEDIMSGVKAFVWILGSGVGDSPELRKFMDERQDCVHLVSSEDYCPNHPTFHSSATATRKLRQVDSDRYSEPIYDFSTTPLSQGTVSSLPTNIKPIRRRQILHLEPEVRLDDSAPPITSDQLEFSLEADILEAAEEAREEIRKNTDALEAWKAQIPSPDAEIITLGTGSAIPSKYRNVSSTLVRVPGYGSYLLDCGENTLGQLRRMYSTSELNDLLHDLRMIWISHMHADHHIGTTSVIKAWFEAVHNGVPARPSLDPSVFEDSTYSTSNQPDYEKMLAIVSTETMHHWLAEYATVEEIGYSRIAPLSITPNRSESSGLYWAHAEYPNTKISASAILGPLLNLADLQAASVSHCSGAKAVCLTFANGFKVSYSGDCRPSSSFARIGAETTVLIHEATFDDELQGDAVAKKHSTTSEALSVGQVMNAKAVVLTHFSQRYQKIPVMETATDGDCSAPPPPALEADDVGAENDDAEDAPIELPDIPKAQNMLDGADPARPTDDVASGEKKTVFRVRNKDMKVCVGFDYMRVKVGDIAKMEYFTPALIRLFAKEEEVKEPSAVEADEGQSRKVVKKKRSKRFN